MSFYSAILPPSSYDISLSLLPSPQDWPKKNNFFVDLIIFICHLVLVGCQNVHTYSHVSLTVRYSSFPVPDRFHYSVMANVTEIAALQKKKKISRGKSLFGSFF